MSEFYNFILTGKYYIMNTYDCSATDCTDSDFFRVTLFMFLASVIFIIVFVSGNLFDCICECKCCTARCIKFLVVVSFNYLYVIT